MQDASTHHGISLRGQAFDWRLALLAILTLVSAATMLLPAMASARTTRAYESSLGSFGSDGPRDLAVDQSNGDIYAFDAGKVRRYNAAGAPKNFTAGPDAGTNILTGFSSFGDVAVDSSGGPLSGTIYVASGEGLTVDAFGPTGAELGAITGSGVPGGKFYAMTGIAVDQSNGALYVVEPQGATKAPNGDFVGLPGKIWRFQPSSPSGTITDADYTLAGITTGGGQDVAVGTGSVYLVRDIPTAVGDAVLRFAATDFSASVPTADFNVVSEQVTGVGVDGKNGDLYVNHSNGIAVYDASGTHLYDFSAAAYTGTRSEGIAVKSAASGAATKAYVSDPGSNRQIDVFGAVTQVPAYTHLTVASFGPDGTSASDFGGDISKLAFDEAARKLYVLAPNAPGIYGFDASAPPAFPLLGAFDPLGVVDTGNFPGVAVDNTALASAGNLYYASRETDLLYGFDGSGAVLPGFPIDPATSPGAPDGSPKDLCGVAVDSAGNVWVANSGSSRILKYSPAGASLPGAIGTSAQGAPCDLAFDSGDDLYVTVPKGIFKYTAASGYTAATQVSGRAVGGDTSILIAVDPTTDHLYVVQGSNFPWGGAYNWIDEYDSDGKLLDEFTLEVPVSSALKGIAVDPANQHIYVANRASEGGSQVHVLGPGLLYPEARTTPATSLTNTSATLNGAIVTQGVALSDCHFEYVTLGAFRVSGFDDLSSGGSLPCTPSAGAIPLDLFEHPVSAAVSGLAKNSEYRFRLSATNAQGSTTTEAAAVATHGPPDAETVGAPVRTTTSAQLNGRVNPRGATTAYHFEYGDQGPCDSNPCTSTPDRSAPAGTLMRLVTEEIGELAPDTTYYYRLVADNGNADGPESGAGMTVNTRASEAPLDHGDFPGPPGSDRAYEQVSMADTNGNPVGGGIFSDDGERVLYGVLGGTEIGEVGSAGSMFNADRTPSGWRSKLITPSRDEQNSPNWGVLEGGGDLSDLVAINVAPDASGFAPAIWRLSQVGQQQKLFEPIVPQELGGSLSGYFGASADTSRVVAMLGGGVLDPAFPAAAAEQNLYDISSGGTPQLVSLLPGDAAATCGVEPDDSSFSSPPQSSNWISSDGSVVYFVTRGSTCSSQPQLYARDIGAAATKSISGAPISGPTCGAALIQAIPGAAFLWTQSRLATDDTAPAACGSTPGNDPDGDVYRYELSTEALECVTCTTPGLDADVIGSSSAQIAVADDGSRVYFRSETRLLPGAPLDGQPGAYRVEVASGDLAYIGPFDAPIGATVVSYTPDGSQLVLRSASPALNPLGGATDNGGKSQFYRYDDRDRSLVCVSCPHDGSQPVAALGGGAALSDGGIIGFSTATPLVSADQNTVGVGQDPGAGTDIYEWRDGRYLLVTDGLTEWEPGDVPGVGYISPSGRDLFFLAAAQLTPDALDGYRRLYDARIGGGIEFPKPPPPCPLEVCQGTPKGAPAEQEPGSGNFAGSGNRKPPATKPKARRCAKGQRKVRRNGKAQCVKSSKKRNAKHNRRAAR